MDHVCEKSDKKYTPPIIRNRGGDEEVFVYITSCVHDTGKATKWKFKNHQWINGYKIKASNNEIWIPNHLHLFNQKAVEKGVWVNKSFYDKMAFV